MSFFIITIYASMRVEYNNVSTMMHVNVTTRLKNKKADCQF